MSNTEILAHDVPLTEHLACLAKHLGHSGYRTLQDSTASYHLLRSFAESHPDDPVIFDAIDFVLVSFD